MPADNELKYKVTVASDVTGAVEAEKAIGKVDEAAKSAGKGVEEASQQVNGLGENFEKGAAAGRVLGEVSRGNVLAVGQLGAAIKVLGTLMRTNLIGVLITLGAIAANVLLPIIKGFQDKKKAAEDAGKAIDQAREAARKLGEEKLEGLKREIDAVKQSAAEAVEQLERAQKAAETVAAAQDDLDRARVDANPNLSDAERARAKTQIDDRATIRQTTSADERAAAEVKINARLRDETQRAETTAGARYTTAAKSAEFAAKDSADIEATINTRRQILREELKRLGNERVTTGSASPERAGIDAEIAALEKALATVADDTRIDAAKRAAESTEELTTRTKLLDEANRAAISAAEQLAKSETRLADLRKTEAAVKPLREETRKLQLESQLAPERAARQTRIGEISREADEAARAGDWNTVSRLGQERSTLEKRGQGERSSGGSAPQTGLREVAGAAQEVAGAIKSQEPDGLREAVGGIIQIRDTYIATQGLQRQQFKEFAAAVKATSDGFRRELNEVKARMENIRSMQQ